MHVYQASYLNKPNFVCSLCVGDQFLQTTISATGHANAKCNYCGGKRPSIPLSELAEYCEKVFGNFYQQTSRTDAVIYHNRSPEGVDIYECLHELLDCSDELCRDLGLMLLNRLGLNDGEDPDPYYIRRSELGDQIGEQWARVSDSLKFQARLVNPELTRLLDLVFGRISDDVTAEGFDVFTAAGPGKALRRLFRARVFQSEVALEAALKHPERALGPLPKGLGRAGRMNASGVSVFYGATSMEVALSEVRPPVGSRVLIGEFEVVRPLKILDLDELGEIGSAGSASLFDPITMEQQARCDFLRTLTSQLIMPVLPESEQHSYLITQAIADYLATHEKLNVDGIYFRSAQNAGGGAQAKRRNVVLFNKASSVERAELEFQHERSSQLMGSEDGVAYMQPRIWNNARGRQDQRGASDEPDAREVTLRLDLNSMMIHTVESIKIVTSCDDVAYHEK